jgi:uncharacterized protein DUF4192
VNTSTGNAPVRIRLSGPGEIAAAIPHLVGFRPEHSLVVVALKGPTSRIVVTMRFDLPPAQFDRRCAGEVASRAAHAGADAIVVACYPGRGTLGIPPRRRLVKAIRRAAREHGVSVREALCILGERYRSYLCTDQACCPPDGSDIPGDYDVDALTGLAAARALSGRSVLADRAALVRSLLPPTGEDADLMQLEIEAVEEGRSDLAPTLDTVEQCLRRFFDPHSATLSIEEAAAVAVALSDVLVRDLALMRFVDDDEVLDAALRMLQVAARLVPPPHDAPVCTLFACLAYADGNGALANVGLDRALDSNPGYSLALLIREALARQVPPSILRATWNANAFLEAGLADWPGDDAGR